ncbi:hypothetical protein TNIN_156251 [Trichonephila inaurata madagascariensis]|uniref:Uncharacterized protein n=1 Tax=Trichonephila inaurata madagascariensis TaxID=2747483 RepID=A0A8X7BW24_9ARAC|nr:hypothetical protein TNIN_156251 [Trichonephila inaurata madagascariensis]
MMAGTPNPYPVSDEAFCHGFSGISLGGMTSGHRGVAINACKREGEANQMVEMVQLDRYGRANLSTVKKKGLYGAHGMPLDCTRWHGMQHRSF